MSDMYTLLTQGSPQFELNTQPESGSPASLGFVQLSDGKLLPYAEFVKALFKRESFRHMADHARGGVCEEAGELSTAIKRHVVYNKAPDIHNIIEELGDLRFFMQAVMGLYGISEQQVLQHNAAKLMVRYEELEYSDQAAQKRADKAGKEEA